MNDAVLSGGTVYPLNLMGQGTDVNQRVGRKVTLRSVYINANFYNWVSTGGLTIPQGVFGKMSVVYDSQPNGATAPPAYTDIYQAYSGALVAPIDPMNLTNRDRFKVLYTTYFHIGAFTLDNSTPTPKIIGGSPVNTSRKVVKKFNLPTIFGNTGNTIGDIQTGSLLLCFIVDTNNGAGVDWYARVRFTDS